MVPATFSFNQSCGNIGCRPSFFLDFSTMFIQAHHVESIILSDLTFFMFPVTLPLPPAIKLSFQLFLQSVCSSIYSTSYQSVYSFLHLYLLSLKNE
jgi:hypothetical protein